MSKPPRRPSQGRKKAESLLSGHRPSPLARLLRRSESRDAWTAQLRALLPQEVGAECQVANVRDHVLTVHISNAAWATRFRLLTPALLPKLNHLADFSAISEIRVKVSPGVEPSARIPSISQSNRDLRPAPRAKPPDGETLTAFAATLEYDQLREAILRLARHAEARTEAQAATPERGAQPINPRRNPRPDEEP